MTWLLRLLGISPVTAILFAVSLAAVPAAWFAGRWHQSTIDKVEEKNAELIKSNAALAKAKDDAAAIVLKQAEATGRERDARIAAEKDADEQEALARKKDKELEDARNFVCPPVVSVPALPTAPLPAKPSCSYDDDEYNRLLNRYPAGTISRH